MATQIALTAVISEAVAVDELFHEDSERNGWYLVLDASGMDLSDLTDVLLPDLDHEFLFDPRYDGIENADWMVHQMRAPNLHPSRWFEPFYEGERESP